jgi:tetratricopeptide (TPR) repeat protein
LSHKNPELAAKEFAAVLAIDPHNLDAQANLGVLLFFQGQYADAIPQLKAAVEMKADLWKIRSLLGMAERRTGDDKEGRGDLEAAYPHLDEEKLKIEVGRELIESYASTDDPDKAAQIIAALLKTRTYEPGAVVHLIQNSFRDGCSGDVGVGTRGARFGADASGDGPRTTARP